MNRRYYGTTKTIKAGYRDKLTKRMHEKQIDRDDLVHKNREEKAIKKWKKENVDG